MKAMPATSLIIGGDSSIGTALSAFIRSQGENVICTSRRSQSEHPHLDLTGDVSGWRPPEGIGTAYFCAARTSIAGCSNDPQGSELVNVNNTMTVIHKLSERGVFVVFPSTNLVFDGLLPYRNENDAVRPMNIYGAHKARTEQALTALAGKAAVLRMTKVIGPGFSRFAAWRSALQRAEKIEVLSDLAFSPIPIELAVKAMYQLAATKSGGIWHLSGKRDISWWDAAYFLARQLDVDPDLVLPTTVEAAGVGVDASPRFTTLNMSKFESEFGTGAPDPWTTLKRCVGNNGKTECYHNDAEPALCA